MANALPPGTAAKMVAAYPQRRIYRVQLRYAPHQDQIEADTVSVQPDGSLVFWRGGVLAVAIPSQHWHRVDVVESA